MYRYPCAFEKGASVTNLSQKSASKKSVEGSTPLSQNSIDNNEKAAAAISDVTDEWAGYNKCHLYAHYDYYELIIIFCH